MKSLIAALIATSVGLGVLAIAGLGDQRAGGISLMLLCGLVAYAVNWLAFIPAAIAKSEKYYDITGSLTYFTTIIMACYLSQPLDIRAMLVAAMVLIWTIRLGSFLFARISADGHDRRFNEIKVKPMRFFTAWTIQGTWVALTSAAAYLVITSGKNAPIDASLFIGTVMWIAGFAFEVTADNQKKAFKADPENTGKFIQTGLWSWCRHPNYFGEIVLWSGVYVTALPLLAGSSWIVTISPLFVYFLLTRVSGIPLLERGGKKRWGDDPDYQAYLERTPRLLPRPPRS